MTDLEETIAQGLMERFIGRDGRVRIRPTPEGARAVGLDILADALEACKRGEHRPFDTKGPTGVLPCACTTGPCH